MRPSTRLTVTAGVAAVLGTVPLGVMFANVTWLFPAAAAVAMVTAFHVLARVLRLPAPLVPLAGTLGLLLFLCWRFARPASLAGLLPTGRSFALLGGTLHDAFADVSTYAIPAPTTPALVLLVTLAAGAAAVVMDAIAVGARRPATAGLVLLALYAVPTAVSTSTLPWPYFAIGASGFLLLLLTEERERLLRWGRPVSPTDPAWQGDPTPARPTGRRAGLVALAIAVIVPSLVPGLSASGLSGLGPVGSDGSGGNRLDPFATLRGLLLRGDPPYELMRLRSPDQDPYYLRTLVLDRYTDAGWGMSSPRGEMLPAGNLPGPELAATREPGDTRQLTAAVTMTRYQDRYLPTLDGTTHIDGLAPAQWRYDPDRAMVFSSSTTTAGQSYTLSVREPRPTVAALRRAPPLRPDDPARLRWAEVPVDLPAPLTHLVRQLTDNQPTPYDEVLAVYRYFSPANGFAYTTATRDGSSGSDLANFALGQRQGYCQQYAAAMAIMLRVAGVPARVVLGFTHHGAPRNGTWSIMNTDAHAWVEAYLAGIGWVPFDPTPPDPTTPGRSQGLPWAPTLGSLSRPVPSDGVQPSDVPSPGRGNRTRPDTGTDPALAGPAPGRVTPTEVLGGLGVLVALLLLASPGVVRVAQRRSRLATAGRGGPRPAARAAWDELVATATDLDIALRPEESPRASAARLITEVPLSGPAADALRLLALAEERARYARDPAVDGDLPTAIGAVRRGLGAARGRGRRWLARCAPPSVLRRFRESVAQGNDRVSRHLERFGLAVRRLAPRRWSPR